jgi:hypothetical protein
MGLFSNNDSHWSIDFALKADMNGVLLVMVPVTGLGGLYGCEMLRIPHCLDNRPTDGGKVLSLTHLPHFTPQKHYYFYVSGTHFC